MSSAVGMMDEAYFVGRREILEWINNTLQLNLTKIEETASGCVALQLMDVCYPGQVSIQKLNWGAKNDYEFVQNYKLLQTAFDKFQVEKHIPVDKIVRAKYQDNLEFMQWFKRFVEITGPVPDYDPVAARSKGRGAPKGSISGPQPRGSIRKDSASLSATRKPSKAVSTTTSRHGTRQSARSGGIPDTAEIEANTNSAEIARLNAELAESYEISEGLRNTSDLLERERDFYFEKLRDIEVILQSMDGKGIDEVELIYKILYTSMDNTAGGSKEKSSLNKVY